MNKHNENSETDNTTNAKLVFSDDALVVDYLNALLASAPSSNLDSSEIQFVHLATKPSWETSGIGHLAVNSPMVFDAGLSKTVAEEFRKENESLKFRAELAKIDIQVLRDENDILKSEVARLTAQLTEISCSLDASLMQNNELQRMMDSQHKRFEELVADNNRVAAEREADELKQEDISEANIALVPDYVEAVVTADEEPVLNLELQEMLNSESVVLAVEVGDNPVHFTMDERPLLVMEADKAAILEEQLTINQASQKSKPEIPVFSATHVINSNIQQTQTDSKIIKQSQVAVPQKTAELEPLTKGTSVTTIIDIQPFNPAIEAVAKPMFMEQQPVVEPLPVVMEQENNETLREPLRIEDPEDIDIEAVPVPKVVAKRNVRNYEDIQKEADPANEAVTWHKIAS